MKKNLSLASFLITAVLVFVPVFALAQTGSVPASSSSSAGSIRATATPAAATGASTTPAAGSAPSAGAVATPRPISTTAVPIPSAIPSLSVEPVKDCISGPPGTDCATSSSANNFDLIAIVATAFLAVLGILGSKVIKKRGQDNRAQVEQSSYDGNNQQKDENRCDNIKEVIEQKKKELAEMVKNWPEEKLKQMAIERALSVLKRDEDIKKVVDTVEDIQSKYNKLNGTIEMLQKRYDLCILSIPSAGKVPYSGTIIENSLKDKAILENIKITKTKQLEDWLLHDVSVNEDQIAKLGEYLSDGPWFMHFWQENKDDVIVVFKDKNFNIKYSDKTTWTEALNYGKSKGIPEEQLDFSVE